MSIFITHKSALEYWRSHGMAQVDYKRRQRYRVPPSNSPDISRVKLLNAQGISYPVNTMVSVPDAKRRSRFVESHVMCEALPEGCIIDVGDGLLVSSPEFCFFQMAQRLSFVELVQLGLELCGSYSLLVNGAVYKDPGIVERGFIDRPALTSQAKLSNFLAHMEGLLGQRRLSRPLRYIRDNSASPMETTLFLLLTLPYKYGGYGFSMPELNAIIKPAKSAKKISSKQSFRCDLFWPEFDVAVEYDSDKHHSGPEQITQDSMKRNSLIAIGVTVITVTNRQIRNTIEFEKIVKQLAINLGRRLRHNENPRFTKVHHQLRIQLGLKIASQKHS